MTQKVAAIITCYFPKIEDLQPLINSLAEQVQFLYFINNGGFDKNAFQFGNLNFEILDAKKNLGTAGGYNLGADKAWKNECTHILLLDQDSECDSKMVSEQLLLEEYLLENGRKVSAIGPLYYCKSNSELAPFIQHSGAKIKRIVSARFSVTFKNKCINYTECSYVISSGSLINKTSWQSIGQKKEGLFLDFTDIEWGLRGNSLGFQCFGSFNAKMFHLIGDEQAHILGRKISLHSPLRHYYAFRNCIWLTKQNYIPIGTRLNYFAKLAPKLIIYSLFSKEPVKQIKYMLTGIWHGLTGQMGAWT